MEAAVEAGELKRARSLLEDDESLVNEVVDRLSAIRPGALKLLGSLQLMTTIARLGSFTEMYMTALEEGVDLGTNAFSVIESIRKRSPDEIIALCQALADETSQIPEFRDGDSSPTQELLGIAADVEALKARCKDTGKALRNKYQAQNKVLRATLIDQRVQLNQDSTALTKEDEEFTALIDDRLIGTLGSCISSQSLEDGFLHEAYSYDSKMPYRDVFVPRPGAVLERALSQPHDYLNCACCSKVGGSVSSTLPATSILYHLYCEAGALVNVSDLWTAFLGVVNDDSEDGERHALVQFYRALSELRIMGYVKQSKKKADHIAKLKWL